MKLCADDLLCLECDKKNEEGLKLIAIEKAAATAEAAARSRAVESGAVNNDPVMLDPRRRPIARFLPLLQIISRLKIHHVSNLLSISGVQVSAVCAFDASV